MKHLENILIKKLFLIISMMMCFLVLFFSFGTNVSARWGFFTTNIYEFKQNITNMEKEDIVVVVVDSGFDTSSSWFQGRVLDKHAAVCNSKECTVSKEYGPDEGDGHGTHVMGIIAQGTHNNVKFIPIKIEQEEIDGVKIRSARAPVWSYIAQLKLKGVNIKVVNYSMGRNMEKELAKGVTPEVCDIKVVNFFTKSIDLLYDMGVSVILAAGNENVDVSLNCIANATKAITVSAIDIDKNIFKTEYGAGSNFGEEIDFAAPGVDVNSVVPGGFIQSKSGTSMAAPFVSAQISLLYSVCPNCSISTVEEVLQASAVDLGEEGKDVYYGHGYVDMNRAYEYMENKLKTKQIIFSYHGPGKIMFSNGAKSLKASLFKVKNSDPINVEGGVVISFKPLFLCGIKRLVEYNNLITPLVVPKELMKEHQYVVPVFADNGIIKLDVQFSLFRW